MYRTQSSRTIEYINLSYRPNSYLHLFITSAKLTTLRPPCFAARPEFWWTSKQPVCRLSWGRRGSWTVLSEVPGPAREQKDSSNGHRPN